MKFKTFIHRKDCTSVHKLRERVHWVAGTKGPFRLPTGSKQKEIWNLHVRYILESKLRFWVRKVHKCNQLLQRWRPEVQAWTPPTPQLKHALMILFQELEAFEQFHSLEIGNCPVKIRESSDCGILRSLQYVFELYNAHSKVRFWRVSSFKIKKNLG